MNIQEYPQIGEKLYRTRLTNGLTVLVVPKRGFTQKMAYFVTDFGSIHTDFQLEGQVYHAPAGIAHFLEHKMFDLPGRDVSAEFAALGANVNAFTSFDMTAYYFSCTENFDKALGLLLEFVSTPYFTGESVEKELGIIDQEIGMYEDSPDSRVFDSLTAKMYRRHPIRVPILGTRQSLRQITPELLYACHRGFYTPKNMVLCVVGDVDAQKVCQIAQQVLGEEEKPAAKKLRSWQETMDCDTEPATCEMEVAMPSFQMGFKWEGVGTGEAAIRQEIIGDLAAEALFGESSPLYLQLYEKGWIDSSFGGGFETVDGCALLTCGGDSENAQAVQQAIISRAQELSQEKLPQEDFLRMKRSALGRRIRDLDSFDSTCFRLCAYHFSQYDYFCFPSAYADVTWQEVQNFLQTAVQPSRCGLSIVVPKKPEAQNELD